MTPSNPSPAAGARRGASRRSILFAVAAAVAVAAGGYFWKMRNCCAPPPIDVEAWLAAHRPTAATPLPADFVVEVSNGTGSVAPVFHHDYRVRIEGNGAATLTYWPGYGQPDSLAVHATFSVPDSVVRVLATLARQLEDPPGVLSEAETPVGGRSPHITLQLDNRVIEVRSYQKEPAGSWQDALGRAVREAIPADVWAKCEEAQRRHAAALERR